MKPSQATIELISEKIKRIEELEAKLKESEAMIEALEEVRDHKNRVIDDYFKTVRSLTDRLNRMEKIMREIECETLVYRSDEMAGMIKHIHRLSESALQK